MHFIHHCICILYICYNMIQWYMYHCIIRGYHAQLSNRHCEEKKIFSFLFCIQKIVAEQVLITTPLRRLQNGVQFNGIHTYNVLLVYVLLVCRIHNVYYTNTQIVHCNNRLPFFFIQQVTFTHRRIVQLLLDQSPLFVVVVVEFY